MIRLTITVLEVLVAVLAVFLLTMGLMNILADVMAPEYKQEMLEVIPPVEIIGVE